MTLAVCQTGHSKLSSFDTPCFKTKCEGANISGYRVNMFSLQSGAKNFVGENLYQDKFLNIVFVQNTTK